MAAVIPPYGKREGWKPLNQDDFNSGGAYPEIHIYQYPLDLGREDVKPIDSTTLTLQRDADGRPLYEMILTQNSQRKVTHARATDYKSRWADVTDLEKPSEEEQAKLAEQTSTALQEVLKIKGSMGQLDRAVASTRAKDSYIRYVPDTAVPGYNPACSERIIRIVEKQVDPLEPPKFRNRRAPNSRNSPPPPILAAPPKKLTQEDRVAWRIPPCVSNWKNQKGYTIPLDMRLQADGRGLQDVSVNSKFAGFSEALYVAERLAREEIRLKNDLLKQKKQLEESKREEKLREIAAKARAERAERFTKGTNEPKEEEIQSNDEEKVTSRNGISKSLKMRTWDDIPAEEENTLSKSPAPPKEPPIHVDHRRRASMSSDSSEVSRRKSRLATWKQDSHSRSSNLRPRRSISPDPRRRQASQRVSAEQKSPSDVRRRNFTESRTSAREDHARPSEYYRPNFQRRRSMSPERHSRSESEDDRTRRSPRRQDRESRDDYEENFRRRSDFDHEHSPYRRSPMESRYRGRGNYEEPEGRQRREESSRSVSPNPGRRGCRVEEKRGHDQQFRTETGHERQRTVFPSDRDYSGRLCRQSNSPEPYPSRRETTSRDPRGVRDSGKPYEEGVAWGSRRDSSGPENSAKRPSDRQRRVSPRRGGSQTRGMDELEKSSSNGRRRSPSPVKRRRSSSGEHERRDVVLHPADVEQRHIQAPSRRAEGGVKKDDFKSRLDQLERERRREIEREYRLEVSWSVSLS